MPEPAYTNVDKRVQPEQVYIVYPIQPYRLAVMALLGKMSWAIVWNTADLHTIFLSKTMYRVVLRPFEQYLNNGRALMKLKSLHKINICTVQSYFKMLLCSNKFFLSLSSCIATKWFLRLAWSTCCSEWKQILIYHWYKQTMLYETMLRCSVFPVWTRRKIPVTMRRQSVQTLNPVSLRLHPCLKNWWGN